MSIPVFSELVRGGQALGILPTPTSGRFMISPLDIARIECWLCNNPPIDAAVRAAHLAIDEYYNGDRESAQRWLLKAYEANEAGSSA